MTKDQLSSEGFTVIDVLHCYRCGEEYSPSSLHFVAEDDPLVIVVSMCCPSPNCRGSLRNGIYPVMVTTEGGKSL
jgi:hypothetical protein